MAAPPVLPDPLAAPLSPAPAAETLTLISDDEVQLARGSRRYRVRGLARCLSAESLKVMLRVSAGDHLHLDTVDLYQARQRGLFAKAAALELGAAESAIAGDLSALVMALEPLQDKAIRGALKPDTENAAPALSEAEEAAGLALLRDPNLAERIVADVEAIGVVGEGTNALVGYLACVSRLLAKPLAILIQSTSAAGKSTLMDALLSLMPESHRVHYSAMTGQSLFYIGEGDLKHKILAIAEEEGVRQAAYALKLLQSQGELTIASTGKDPATGKLVTSEYRVEGPVMLCLTTTAIDIDEELLNRCLVLTINETAEQTAAIQQRQRQARTLAGLQAKVRNGRVLAAHRAAQSLLRPLAVVNPYAEALTFASDRVRLRRDHEKYLGLIEAIALLHQQQRPVGVTEVDGAMVDYIEVIRGDIELANQIAHAVLGRSLDELPPQTRRVLGALHAWVCTQAGVDADAHAREGVRFTRRETRAHLGLSDTQLRVHLDRLVQLDYVGIHVGKQGQQYRYYLRFDGDIDSDAAQCGMVLTVPPLAENRTVEPETSRGKTTTSRGSDPDFAGGSRGLRGGVAGGSRGEEIAEEPQRNAGSSVLNAASPENARSRTPKAPRRNGRDDRPAEV